MLHPSSHGRRSLLRHARLFHATDRPFNDGTRRCEPGDRSRWSHTAARSHRRREPAVPYDDPGAGDGGHALARRRDEGTGPGYAAMGDRLREARLARGYSVRGLAERLDVSPSLISQVETGRARPSVNTLYAIASELGLSLDELFSGARSRPAASEPSTDSAPRDLTLPEVPVQRAATRQAIRLASGVVWERLTTASLGSVDFLFVTYEVGGASSSEDALHRHPGQELGFVISGRLEVRVGEAV